MRQTAFEISSRSYALSHKEKKRKQWSNESMIGALEEAERGMPI